MPSYTDIDGVPVSGDRELLTGLLRDTLGFDGLVVSDYYAIAFLQTQHAVAATPAQAAALALEAGLDVELPSVACYGAALVGAVRDGLVAEEFVDRAAARVLRQKCDLGLLDPGWPGPEADLRLPGVQEDLLRVLVASGTPVVLVLVTGRPYAIGPAAGELAGVVQAFFPGEEGGGAIAGVLSGRLVPSGRLPVEMPASPGGQPSSYLRPRLAARHPGSSVDPTPLFAFGHGLSYTSFAYSDLVIDQREIGTDGTAVISCTVRNTGGPGRRRGRSAVPERPGGPGRPARPLAGRLRPGPAGARPGAPGHLPAARRPDRVHRPGPFSRDPGGGTG